MENFAGKVAVVTGGAASIGAAITRSFVEAGTKVVIADIDEAAAQALAQELGADALPVPTDIARDASIEACVAATIKAFGRLDYLVNNACLYLDQGLASTREEWHRALDVNLIGPVIMLRESLAELRKSRGSVVNIASVGGKFGQAGRALYPAAKAATLQLTRNQAVELAEYGIRVNSVSPGWTWSAPIERATKGDRAKADRVAAEIHPLGRVGNPGEIAAAVLFLCSDAAGFITGTDLAVDGGYSAVAGDAGHPIMSLLSE
jgi:NAD(P)-dependent dehydrogenase (short-subunit alcohol dehydrogenase family)